MLQAINIKDVILSDLSSKSFFLEKHIAFIESYSKKKDDYVSSRCDFQVHTGRGREEGWREREGKSIYGVYNPIRKMTS